MNEGVRFSVTVIWLIISTQMLYGQFEQKITLRGGAGVIIPDYQEYSYGLCMNAGLQYNTKSPVSLIANVKYFQLWDTEHGDSYYHDISIGGGLKFKFLRSSTISPYIFAEVSANLLYYYYYYEYAEPIYDPVFDTWYSGNYEEEEALSFGLYTGLGLDIKITENIGLYLQGGYYTSYYDAFASIYTLVGVNISFLKAKNL
jgi:hypothetical protein